MTEALDALVDAIKLIRGFEGCRLTAYQDQVDVWTIGWGETLGVVQTSTWTQEEADNRLRQRVGQFMLNTLQRCPQLHVEPPIRLAACTSFTYNIGVGAFGASSISRKTTRRDYQGAADALLLWNKAGGRVIAGLTMRRKAERARYLER